MAVITSTIGDPWALLYRMISLKLIVILNALDAKIPAAKLILHKKGKLIKIGLLLD